MYQIPIFSKLPKLNHFITTKKEGNLSAVFENDAEIVTKLEKIFKDQHLRVDDVVKMVVEHDNNIMIAGDKYKGISLRNWKKAPKADGLVTDKKNTYLFLLIADCLPVILFDPGKKVLGLMHIGWKNADLNTAALVLATLNKEYGVNPKNLKIGFGPAARKESYIMENPSQINDPRWKSFLEKVDGNKYKVDFVGLAKKQLTDGGILVENIYDCNVDTVKDNRFFSHYRDKNLPVGQQGRFACIVGMQ